MAAPAMAWEDDFSYPDGWLRIVGAPPAGDWNSGTPNPGIVVNSGMCELVSCGGNTFFNTWATTFFGGVRQTQGDVATMSIDFMAGDGGNPGNYWFHYYENRNDWGMCELMGHRDGFQVKEQRNPWRRAFGTLTGYGTWDNLVLVFDFKKVGPGTTGRVFAYLNGVHITAEGAMWPNIPGAGDGLNWGRKGHSTMQDVDHVRLRTWDRTAGNCYMDNFLSPPPVELPLDIYPHDDPNLLTQNIQGKGRVPMAILGSDDAAAADINAATVSVAGGLVTVIKTSISDEDGDGEDDLQIHVSRRDLLLALGLMALDPGTDVEIVVNGKLLDGSSFVAKDTVTLQARQD
jgi:hypothetical protein